MLVMAIEITHLPFWPFLISLALISILLYTRAVRSNNWNLVIRSAFSSRATQQLIREENFMDNTFSGLLVLTFFFSFALLIFNVNEFFEVTKVTYGLLTFTIILVSTFAIYLTKVVGLYLVQYLFEANEMYEEYLIGLFNINVLYGLILIPINLLFIYAIGISKPHLIYSAIILGGMTLLFRYIRVIEMARRWNMKWHNIILYLCTLEILPIILMIKALDYFGLITDLT